ncbi:MAG: hypothetical protein LBH25_11660, partial [Fibromonadaceae bacterium]|nr:hypothetical protein [Fibromonadaceae bacterium]
MAKVGVLSCALASLAFAVIMLLACSDFGHGTSSQIEEQTQNDTGINILTSAFPSPKEQNPFSVENMNKAFKSFILEKNANAKDIPELKANFLYVRFLPYGRQGEHELKAYDSSLALFKYPMDYNEIRKPVVYIDKTLPDSIVPYFASVPVGYEFGATPYEILQELFLTQPLEEDDGDSQEGSRFVRAKKSNKANKEISAYMKSQGLAPSQFEATVLINSGNSEIVGAADGQNRILARSSSAPDDMVAWSWPWEKWTRWTPGGTLTFKDSSLVGNQPLVDARVTAGYIYYWRSSWTDSKGHFKSPEKWTYSVHYEVLFDSYDFLLKDGHSWGGWYATDLSHKKKGTSYHQWDENFTGDVAKWCVVWTAAWNYWHGSDIGGLQRPRQSNWLNRMDIKVYYEPNNFDVKGRYRNPAIFEDIQIQAYDRKHVAIYGTTIHEIAHSVHFANLDLSAGNAVAGASMGYLANVAGYSPLSASAAVLGVKGWQSLKYEGLPLILKESYARGVQRYLVIKRYGAGAWNRILYDNHWYDNEYTGIFEDLEDTNTTFANAKNDKNPCDRVSGITVPMAEKVFFKSDSWNGFKNNLMKAYPNGF